MGSAERLVSMITVQGIALTLLVACAIAADPCDSTAPPEPGPAPSPTPTPPNPCDTTLSPAPAPTPAPTPGCDDKPADWKSTAGSTCADYVSKAWCTSDGGYGSGWDKSTDGSFDDWAVNGVAATVACCGCGGGSTVTGRQACQGHSHDTATPTMVETAVPMMQPMQMGAPAVSAMPVGGGAFATQSMPTGPYLM